MSRYRRTINLDVPPADAFAYLARFSNAAQWDPGVGAAEMLTPEPVDVGSAFELDVLIMGRALPFRYEVIEHERPTRVTLRAERHPFVSLDTIEVAPTDTGCTLTYDADLRLVGPYRVFSPLLDLAFRRIGDRALDGLRAAFASGVASAA